MYKRYFPSLVTLASIAAIIVSVLVIVAVVTKQLEQDGWGGAAFVLGMMALSLGFGFYKRRQVRRRGLPDTSAQFVDSVREQFAASLMPHKSQLIASNLALVHAAYAEFEEAEARLHGVSWADLPEALDIARYQARAALAYLEGRDTGRGLADARRAHRLADLPQLTFGRSRVRRITQLYVAWGEALGGAKPNLPAFEALRDDPSPLVRAMALAALARALHDRGEEARYTTVRAELVALAPRALGLLWHARAERQPESAPAVDASIAVVTSRMCATHPEVVAKGTCRRCGSFACAACARAGQGDRWYCPACAERLVEHSRQHLPLAARARGLSALPFAAGAFYALFGVTGALERLAEGEAPGQVALTVLFIGVLAFGCYRAGSALLRLTPARGPFVRMAWMLVLVVIPVGTVLGIYALVALRKSRMLVLSGDDFVDGLALGSLKLRTSWWIVVVSVLNVALALFGLVIAQM